MSKTNKVDNLLQLADDVVSLHRRLCTLTVALKSTVDRLHDLAEQVNEEQYEEWAKR